MLPCLKDLDAVRAYITAQAIGNAGDQDNEDDTNTVINGEDNGAGDEIPQEEENNVLNQGDVNPVPMPPCSPRNSRGSSKSLKIEGKSYQIRKQKINSMLSKIEQDSSQHHSEHLKEQAALLSTMLTIETRN